MYMERRSPRWYPLVNIVNCFKEPQVFSYLTLKELNNP